MMEKGRDVIGDFVTEVCPTPHDDDIAKLRLPFARQMTKDALAQHRCVIARR
jgi:hypothetical protein